MNRLIRRLFALLPLALLLAVSVRAAERDALLERARAYDGRFADVNAESWYYPYVAAGYEYALIDGRGGSFEPEAEVTVAELLTLSARIHAAYAGETIPEAGEGAPWYEPYLLYLSAGGLLDKTITAYDAPATRAQLAGIFAVSLPAECFDDRNAALVTDAYASGGCIADVDEYTPYQPQILWLYRQGLLAGMDGAGSFWPDKTVSRAEAAAIIARMVEPSLRLTPEWAAAPRWSAAGRTLASLVEAPDDAVEAPAFDDLEAIDALVRRMLAGGGNTISLRYDRTLTRSDAAALANCFTARVKSYCEQMYNTVVCRIWSRGAAELSFSATACADEQLARYRAETMEKAIEIHDMLWETGQLSAGMSQYEIARVYFLWLCDHCSYDWDGANDSNSLSHLAYGALVRGKAVCDGYTGAYDLLLKLEGVDCRALYNDTHIWTVATLDGGTYHIDVTWGDWSGRADMRYFGMTEAQSYAEHPW